MELGLNSGELHLQILPVVIILAVAKTWKDPEVGLIISFSNLSIHLCSYWLFLKMDLRTSIFYGSLR